MNAQLTLLILIGASIVLLTALLLSALVYNIFRPTPEPLKLGNVSGVDVVARVEIGEEFDFWTREHLELNNVIGVTRTRYGIPYGIACIVRVHGDGLYTARRID